MWVRGGKLFILFGWLRNKNKTILNVFIPKCKLISAFPERQVLLAQEGIKIHKHLLASVLKQLSCLLKEEKRNEQKSFSPSTGFGFI